MPETRVIIVEARPVRRQRLVALITADPRACLVTSCATLMEAYTQIEAEVPEIVLVSQRMAAAPEYAMLARLIEILDVRPISYVEDLPEEQILTQIWTRRSEDLPAGGTVGKPADGIHGQNLGAAALRRSRPDDAHLPQKSDLSPIRAAIRRPPSLSAQPRAMAQNQTERKRSLSEPLTHDRAGRPGNQEVFILIGASTGGVEALHQVLPSFPTDCPPVVVVQHIRGSFSASFAERLDRICAARVIEARSGVPLMQGQILIAPGDATHLVLAGRHPVQGQLVAGPSVSGHRPSVDALFDSALPFAERVVAALLTGMGSDGARGLLALKNAGAHTLAQDRESSTVYGMPRVAAELGAASRILPLTQMAHALLTAARDKAGHRAAAVNPR